jgi:hypothetical protein
MGTSSTRPCRGFYAMLWIAGLWIAGRGTDMTELTKEQQESVYVASGTTR